MNIVRTVAQFMLVKWLRNTQIKHFLVKDLQCPCKSVGQNERSLWVTAQWWRVTWTQKQTRDNHTSGRQLNSSSVRAAAMSAGCVWVHVHTCVYYVCFYIASFSFMQFSEIPSCFLMTKPCVISRHIWIILKQFPNIAVVLKQIYIFKNAL